MIKELYKCLVKNGVNYVTKDEKSSECWGHVEKPYLIDGHFWTSKGKQYDLRLIGELFDGSCIDLKEVIEHES